jgi:ABC-type sugar transport system permease subunit
MKRLGKKRSLERKYAWVGRLFILPWLIGFLFFFLRPMIQSLIFTFQSIKIGPSGFETSFVGLENYKFAFLKDPNFVRLFTDAIKNMAYEVPIIVMFSLFIAVILKQNFRGRFLARAIFFLPVIITSGVIVQILKEDVLAKSMSDMETVYMFKTTGFADLLLQSGLNSSIVKYFTDIIGKIFDLTWKSGVQILLFLAGLQSIPGSLYEASNVEGATAWESFWKITFPMVSPIILVNIIYSVIDSFTDYGNKVMQLIYTAANIQLRYDYSATLSWIYFISVFAIVGLVVGLISKRIFYMVD